MSKKDYIGPCYCQQNKKNIWKCWNRHLDIGIQIQALLFTQYKALNRLESLKLVPYGFVKYVIFGKVAINVLQAFRRKNDEVNLIKTLPKF